MYYTTLNEIWAHSPCHTGWAKLLRHLDKTGPDDEPLSLLTILESNGIDDAIWALRAVNEPACERDARIFAVRCVRQSAQHLLTDPRSLNALDVAERYAVGMATDNKLQDAIKEALAAWVAAREAEDYAWSENWDAEVDTWDEAQDVAWAAWADAQDAAKAAEAAAKSAAKSAAEIAEWIAAIWGDVKATEADFRVLFCSED